MKLNLLALALILILPNKLTASQKYSPTWDSLDSRPLPSWYDDAKVGIFIHWGVFAVPSFGSEWFWKSWQEGSTNYVNFMKQNYQPNFSYQDFAKDFTAEFYNPDEWAELFEKSGAKYVVLTSKHHEGYTLWPSKYSFSWNAKAVGPHRDLLGDLATAVRNRNLTFGLYHSMYEWFNPLYEQDKANNFTTNQFVTSKTLPELYELVNTYHPAVIWSDGEWEAEDTYWESTKFLAWLYNESPVKDQIVVNDRWGRGTGCKHGGFFSCADRYNPGTLQPHKWENAMTIDKDSWGHRRNTKISDYLTTHDLVKTLTETVSCGGNILINVGPTKEGTIEPVFQERLLELGAWLELNGEAIYGSKPWRVQNDTYTPNVWYTSQADEVYAIVLDWPAGNELSLESVVAVAGDGVEIQLIGVEEILEYRIDEDLVRIQFPDRALVQSQIAWVLKISSNNLAVVHQLK